MNNKWVGWASATACQWAISAGTLKFTIFTSENWGRIKTKVLSSSLSKSFLISINFPTLTSTSLSVFLPPLCVCLCLCMSQYCSLMSGLAALDAKCSSRLGIMTISYYLWTTFVAVVVGIVMVYIIHPGGAAQKEDSEDSKKPMTSSADALLDLIR